MDASPHVALKRKRFRDPEKFAPVVFVSFTILILYLVFMLCHCLPMLQIGVAIGEVNGSSRRRGILQVVFFNIVTAMVIVCYVLSIIVHPGTIPDTPDWEVYPEDMALHQALGEDCLSSNHQETKRTGDRRSCKWCNKYKPDRCHHCRVCRMCILKMDHHCPWIYNCVGFQNYKYFYLLLVYCAIDLHFIVWSMGFSVYRVAFALDVRFLHMFLVLFGETLAIFLGVLVTTFLGFHTWLMISAMTTIEFCEKKQPKKGQSKSERPSHRSVYNLGVVANFRETLGGNLWATLVPIPPELGDGLSFVSVETRLTANIVERDVRRKTHQVMQRPYRYPRAPPSPIFESPRPIRLSISGNVSEPVGVRGNECATISILD